MAEASINMLHQQHDDRMPPSIVAGMTKFMGLSNAKLRQRDVDVDRERQRQRDFSRVCSLVSRMVRVDSIKRVT
jgi:hypothetical protein